MSTVNDPALPDCPVPQNWPQRSLRAKNPKLFALIAATLIASLQGIDPTLHSIAIPQVALSLITDSAGHTNLSTVALIRSIGTIVLAATMLGIGIIGDRNGRKKIMVWGAFTMGAASFIAAMAPNVFVFATGRVIMGVATAMAFGMGIAMVPTLYTRAELPKAFSIVLALQSAAVVGSTLIGGFILENFGWQGLYGFVAILSIIFGFYGSLVLPENKAEHKRKFDNVGVVLAFIGLVLLVYALSQATIRTFLHPIVWGGTLVALIILGIFGWYESRLKEPGFPVVLFKIPAFTAATLAGVMFNFANGTILGQSAAILGWISREGWGPTIPATTVAGLSALLGVGMFFGASASGPLVNRFNLSARFQFVSGMLILAAGLATQFKLDPQKPVMTIGIAMFIIGFGVMWTQAPESVVIMGSAPKDLIGAVGAVKPAVGQTGFGFGLGVAMPLASLFMEDGKTFTPHAYSMGMLVTAGIMVASGIFIYWLMRGEGAEDF